MLGNFDLGNVKWADVDFVYNKVNISKHWIVIAMDMNRGQLFAFDSRSSHTSMKKLTSFLELLTLTLPSLLHYWSVKCFKLDLELGRWHIFRPTSKNLSHMGIMAYLLLNIWNI